MSEVCLPDFPVQERLDFANRLLGQATKAERQTGDIYATFLLDYISRHTTLGEPIAKDGLYGLRRDAGSKETTFVPLAESDRAVHAFFGDIYDKGMPTYREGAKAIFYPIRSDQPPTVTGGVVLLHEMLHAAAGQYTWWRTPHDEWATWHEEYHVFEVEHAMLRRLGGRAYDALVADQAEISQELLETGELAEKALRQTPALDAAIKLFHPNDYEAGLIGSALVLHGLYKAAEHRTEESDITMQVHLTRWLYEGKLPAQPGGRFTRLAVPL